MALVVQTSVAVAPSSSLVRWNRVQPLNEIQLGNQCHAGLDQLRADHSATQIFLQSLADRIELLCTMLRTHARAEMEMSVAFTHFFISLMAWPRVFTTQSTRSSAQDVTQFLYLSATQIAYDNAFQAVIEGEWIRNDFAHILDAYRKSERL